jgi:hypothetical protein
VATVRAGHRESRPRELSLEAAVPPERVLRGHPPDEGTQLTRDARASASPASSGPPSPVGCPPSAMLAEHGRGLNDEQGLSPSGDPPTGENPEPAVPIAQPRPRRSSLLHDQLLPQAQILGDQVRSGCEPCRDRSPCPPDHTEPPSVLDQTGVFHRPGQKERTVDRVLAPYRSEASRRGAKNCSRFSSFPRANGRRSERRT